MLPDTNLKSRELFKPRITITKLNFSRNKKTISGIYDTVGIGFIIEN